MKDIFDKYITYRKEIDASSERLSKLHARHIKCKSGCDKCCMDYSIFPLEFYFILNELKESGVKTNFNSWPHNEECIFLKDSLCQIYTHRPTICRTHGLPLLFLNENEDWELSACEMNFTNFDLEAFTESNTFPQDTFNSKLFLLNKAFIAEFKDVEYEEFDLIPIRKLKEYL